MAHGLAPDYEKAFLSITHHRTPAFWWGLPTIGALRVRATQPMEARLGLSSQASRQGPVVVLLAERLQQARRQTLYGRLRAVFSHITPSMGALVGTPSLCRASPVGAPLTGHTILTRERSLRTACYRIRSICIMPGKAYLKPRMAG